MSLFDDVKTKNEDLLPEGRVLERLEKGLNDIKRVLMDERLPEIILNKVTVSPGLNHPNPIKLALLNSKDRKMDVDVFLDFYKKEDANGLTVDNIVPVLKIQTSKEYPSYITSTPTHINETPLEVNIDYLTVLNQLVNNIYSSAEDMKNQVTDAEVVEKLGKDLDLAADDVYKFFNNYQIRNNAALDLQMQLEKILDPAFEVGLDKDIEKFLKNPDYKVIKQIGK